MDIRKFFGTLPNSSGTNKPFKESKESKEQSSKESKLEKDEYLAIYTDGSTFNNGSKTKKIYGGIGVFFGPNDPLNISKEVTSMDFPPNEGLSVSNNTCELLAVIRGIEKLMISLGETELYKMNKMKVYSDSEYLINCVTKWYSGWERNGWKRSDKKSPVKNKYLIQRLKSYVDQFKIRLIHIKAHRNPPDVDLDHQLYKIWYGNKMADKLAREGSKKSMKLCQC
jgi:ribonuclease HI